MSDAKPQPDADRTRRLTVWLVCGAFTLFGVTWRLWTPQTVFPQIQFFAFGTHIPGWVDWFLLGVCLVALTVVPFWRRRISLVIFAVSTALLMLLDQHRLQPWAYEFVLIAVVLATADDCRAVFWLRVLVVSLYVHSASSKFDASFLDTHGQELVNAAAGVFGLSFSGWNEPARKALAFSLPLFELLAAIGLCVPRFRRTAVVGSIVMHLLLFLALGPWGLNHKPGVLIWNVFFIGQNVLLFWPVEGRPPKAESEEGEGRASVFRFRFSFAAIVITGAALLPVLEPFGLFDHWPAWALYASKPERITVYVHALQRDRLPADVRKFTAPVEGGPWCEIDCDRWSLETLNAPIYPQGRFRLAVALAVAEGAELGPAIRVLEESPADRRTGQRTRREITGIRELRRRCTEFTGNTTRR